jgi:hypothetical protein
LWGIYVGKLSEWGRWVWLEAELAAPPAVRRAVIPGLYEIKEIAQLLARPFLTAYQLQGQAEGGPLTVAFAGRKHTGASLSTLLFVEKPTAEEIGRVPFWSPGKLADLPGDIVVVEATRYLIRRLPYSQGIVLPRIVYHTADTRGDWEDVRERFRKTIHKNELRWIRKYGYEYDVSHDPRDFEAFYHQMYLLTMDDRHGELAAPMPIGEAYQIFRHGCLFRVLREGNWVSGVVCHPQHKVLIADIVGVRNGDARLANEGAISTIYYATIHWANQHGYEGVNFLGSPPYLASGNFQHKRKWGGTVTIPPDVYRRMWMRVRHHTPAVSQFLANNPLAVIGEDGKLHGLIVVEDPQQVSAETRAEWEARYATPGLNSLMVRSVASLAGGSAHVQDPALVIPLPRISSMEGA